MYDFEFPSFKCDYAFTERERELIELKPRPLVSDWCLSDLEFHRPAYNAEGPFRLRKWQIFPSNAFLIYPRELMVGTTQTGKSLISDAIMFYCMKVLKINGMIAYSENNTVETVFKDRIRVMIEENESLRCLWDGDEDSMTVARLKLSSCIWRIASAFNKNTLATFAAGVTIGSEVGKWSKVKFDPVLTLEGRQGSYYSNGFLRTVLETSAFDVGDYMYKELFASGTFILHPFYKCPHCGKWQEWTDSQIKTREEHFRYEEVIKYKFDACFYECIECKNEITEQDRVRASESMVWAAPEINQEDFTQKAEIINPDGTIEGVQPNGKRYGVETIAFVWPRLVDTGYKFWQNLAAYFKNKNDPIKLKTYQAETMSRYTGAKTGRVELSYIEGKKDDYIKNIVPDDVLVITAGFDTHDDRWNYAYFGWCFGCQIKVLKHGTIPCKKDEYKDVASLLAHFRTSLDQDVMSWSDGAVVDFRSALMDRGGHRGPDVDYLCSRIPNLKACIGSKNKPDYTKPVIYKSDKAEYYWQQTEIVSQLTGQIIESDDFYLPQDVLSEFINQLMRQWFLKKIGPDGSESIKWMHGGDDHYRDCFNLAYSAGKLLGLDKIMLDGNACESLYNSRISINSGAPQQKTVQQPSKTVQRNSGSHYFNRALRR